METTKEERDQWRDRIRGAHPLEHTSNPRFTMLLLNDADRLAAIERDLGELIAKYQSDTGPDYVPAEDGEARQYVLDALSDVVDDLRAILDPET